MSSTAKRSRCKRIYNGYSYGINSTNKKTGKIYLRCSDSNCPGTCHEFPEGVYTEKKSHNHPPDLNLTQMPESNNDVEQDVPTSVKMRLIYDMVAQRHPEAAKRIPFSKIQRSMRRWMTGH